MRTVDSIIVAAPLERVFGVAADVERWPEFLGHYRWVRMRERHRRGGVVEMAAWRPFGPLRYPTWWVSEMEAVPANNTIQYRHIEGITRHMDVEWSLREASTGTSISIVHLWDGPSWPLVGRLAANVVIGPVFIHHIASRTLAGVKRRAEEA